MKCRPPLYDTAQYDCINYQFYTVEFTYSTTLDRCEMQVLAVTLCGMVVGCLILSRMAPTHDLYGSMAV